MPRIAATVLAVLATAGPMAGAGSLRLLGSVDPALERGLATVSAVESPFYAEAPVRNGRFTFRGLEPGPYTVTVLDPRWGMTRRTVQVTESFADADGRVVAELSLEQSDAARSTRVRQEGTVSVASLKVAPKARSAVRKAHSRLARGDIEGGVQLLERAVEISPTFVQAWNELGTIAYKAGRYVEAEQRFRKALEHEPLSFAPMVNLGGALLSQGRYDEALSFNLMARSMQPEDALANSQLGMNFFHKGQLHKAREFLLRAKEADTSHFSYPQIFLAQVYALQGEPEAARGELEELLRLHPDAEISTVARQALRQLGFSGVVD